MHACMNKGTHFSTGPTTSSRHSKKNIKALILVLGLLQVVGTVKINGLARTPATEHACMHEKIYKGTHFSTGPTTSSRHSKNGLIIKFAKFPS